MIGRLTTLVLVGISLHSNAQFGDLLKKGLDAGTKSADEALDKERARIDSSDFNYAIQVLDNSGMMNIRDSDESAIKTADDARGLLKDKSSQTPSQRCRFTLMLAEKNYEGRIWELAESMFLQAKQQYEDEGITDDINYSKVFADLGLLYASMGRTTASLKYAEDARELREKSLGKASKAYASSLNNTAVLYQELARYNDAERNFEQALGLVKAKMGPESHEYAVVLNNLAILYAEIGRYDAGVQNLVQVSTILDKLKKKSVSDQVGFRSNLAHLYQQTGKYTEAEVIYLKLQKDLGTSPYLAGIKNNLGLLYIQMGKMDQVEKYLKESASFYKSRFGDKNPNYAKVLNDLGNFYRMQGRFDEAEQNLQQSLTIRTEALDANHPDFVKSQEDLGILYWKKGDLTKASEMYKVSMEKSLDFINRYFPPMSESEKTKYWDVLQPRFQRYYNYCLEASKTNPDAVQSMYDYQMATKGLLLSSTNRIKQIILSSGNDDLIKEYTGWLDKKEALARYYSLSREELKNQKVDLASLEKEANDVERSLSSKSEEFTQGYKAAGVSSREVAGTLADNEAVIEVVRLRVFDKDFTTNVKYAVLVLIKGAAPKLVVLDNGNELETRFAKFYKNAVMQRIPDEISYVQFWSKIDPLLTGKKVLYLSPDGVYAQINVNTIKKPGGDFVGNRFDVVTLGNSRDLMKLRNQKPAAKKEAFLLGFPDYGGAAPALPGTKIEIDGVAKVLKLAGYKVSQQMQASATEANIKAIAGPALVHIATHGYFLPDAEDAIGIHAEHARNNPLLRSGLILAGAPDPSKEEQKADLQSNDNGILTAYEAMNLNLEGTDLIVLSACETGLGEVKAGEGVYGLQRAFQVAGAKALIMSLWKVDDTATQMLMMSFYTNWTKTGNKLKAFNSAQQQLMANPKYKDPYYWGAFVMLGL